MRMTTGEKERRTHRCVRRSHSRLFATRRSIPASALLHRKKQSGVTHAFEAERRKPFHACGLIPQQPLPSRPLLSSATGRDNPFIESRAAPKADRKEITRSVSYFNKSNRRYTDPANKPLIGFHQVLATIWRMCKIRSFA